MTSNKIPIIWVRRVEIHLLIQKNGVIFVVVVVVVVREKKGEVVGGWTSQ